MSSDSLYPALLAPCTLAGKHLRNRLMHASMTTLMGENGRVTDRLIQYHANRAQGGAALIVTEPLSMAPHQKTPYKVRAWNDDNHLFHQFFSTGSNHRTDDYGGNLENRTRLITELVAALRALCGNNFIIGLKLPGIDGVSGGVGPAEAARIATQLTRPRNIDYVCFAQGSHSRALELHVPDGHGPRAPYMPLIRELRAAVCGVPLVALGRITDPAEADSIIESGDAEFVALGRPLVTDPAWLNKASRGRAHAIRYCVSCNTCWDTIVTEHKPIACDNNPRVGAKDEVDWWPRHKYWRCYCRRRNIRLGQRKIFTI